MDPPGSASCLRAMEHVNVSGKFLSRKESHERARGPALCRPNRYVSTRARGSEKLARVCSPDLFRSVKRPFPPPSPPLPSPPSTVHGKKRVHKAHDKCAPKINNGIISVYKLISCFFDARLSRSRIEIARFQPAGRPADSSGSRSSEVVDFGLSCADFYRLKPHLLLDESCTPRRSKKLICARCTVRVSHERAPFGIRMINIGKYAYTRYNLYASARVQFIFLYLTRSRFSRIYINNSRFGLRVSRAD